jgi:REP element-mobilizing transposase RayT
MGKTLAIHWAATTHGTWLHGDPRGSWHNGRLIGADLFLEAECRASMTADAMVLSSDERLLVAEAFGDVVRERRHRIFAATVQATHVHLVLAPLQENITNVIARLKRRSSMAVLNRRREARQSPARMAGLYSRSILDRRDDGPRTLWTAGKFVVYIDHDPHLTNAIEYVRDHNRRANMPADPFDWIEPLYPPPDRAGERWFEEGTLEANF